MKTSMRRAAVSSLLSLAGLGALDAMSPAPVAAQESGIEVGIPAPDAALERLDGSAVSLKELFAAAAGKPVVLEFWATWCGVCKELEPTIEAVQAKYAGRVAFIGVAVSVNQSAERVRRYTAEHLAGFTHLYDRHGNAVAAYDVPATSYVVIVGKDGKVVYTGLGGKQAIDAALEQALR
jgi:thiol-disulfide isomerase/thioredoxin